MYKKWFQYKEIMAGSKRLITSYYLYKLFGETPLRIIAFFVASAAFITSKERRIFSSKYFKLLEKFTHKKYPSFISTYKQFLNYGNSLADKIISFSGGLSAERFCFMDNSEQEIFKYINNKTGIFFLTNHVGNPEILRSLIQSDKYKNPQKVNIFLEKRSCEVFNSFLNKIETNNNLETFAVEEIGIDTSIILSDKLDNGELIFMAGDRISVDNSEKSYSTELLNTKIHLPLGAIKLAQILEHPIFFITCVKENNSFLVYAEEFKTNKKTKNDFLEQLKKDYRNFLEKYTIKYPYQFFHFYGFFKNE